MICINLLPSEKHTFSIQSILTGVSVLAALVFITLCAYGAYRQWTLEKELAKVQIHEQVLAPVREKMELANSKQVVIHKKNSILAGLTKERKPWYRVAAHFSTLTPEKVWLTEFVFHDKEIRIKGASVNYFYIAMFLKQMENDNLITGPVLDKAEQDSKQAFLNFEIVAKVKGMQ